MIFRPRCTYALDTGFIVYNEANYPQSNFAPYTQTPAHAMQLTMSELRERHGTPRDYLLRSGVTEDAIGRLRQGLLE